MIKVVKVLAGFWPIRDEIERAQLFMQPDEIDSAKTREASRKFKAAAWVSAVFSALFLFVAVTAEFVFSAVGVLGIFTSAFLSIAFAFMFVYLRALALLLDEPGLVLVKAKDKSALTMYFRHLIKGIRWLPPIALYAASLYLVATTPGSTQPVALGACLAIGAASLALLYWARGGQNG